MAVLYVGITACTVFFVIATVDFLSIALWLNLDICADSRSLVLFSFWCEGTLWCWSYQEWETTAGCVSISEMCSLIVATFTWLVMCSERIAITMHMYVYNVTVWENKNDFITVYWFFCYLFAGNSFVKFGTLLNVRGVFNQMYGCTVEFIIIMACHSVW